MNLKFYKRKFLFSAILMGLLWIIPKVHAQQLSVTGTVTTAEDGSPLPGVNVVVKNSTTGTVTNVDGEYTLTVQDNSTRLVFSFIGFKTHEVAVNGRTRIDVVLVTDSEQLEEVTVVAFGTQKKSSMVSSIETVNPKELKIPSSNLTTAMAGRLSGVVAYQRSGEPGADNTNFFIRGVTTFGYKKDPLILIDGIELTSTDLARLQPDDIASFSIMKDATATSLYGARGANGVILVTTKSGEEGPAQISVRLENSISMPTQNVELAGPLTYMRLHNEAALTRDPLAILPYPQSKVDNTIAGTNPYVYPAVDWQKMLIKDYTNNKRMNFNVSGGGKVARYYVAGTFNQDNGILKVDNRNNFNNNINLKSYLLRSNVNIDLSKSTEAVVRLHGQFDDYTGPVDGGEGMFRKVMRANPVLFPAYYPVTDETAALQHIMFGNANLGSGLYLNPYADMVRGYKDWSRSLMLAQFEIKQDLSFLIPGLKARGKFMTQRRAGFDVSRFYNPYYYSASGYNRMDDTYSRVLLNEGFATEYLGYSEGKKDIETVTYMEAVVNYNTTIADRHDISGMLVFLRRNQLKANAGDLQLSLPFRNEGLSGRFTYGYDDRYLLEANFGYNGSERFHESQRYGFFPAIGLGWVISNENFWAPLKGTINNLKLRGSYGLVGNDAIGDDEDRFFYLSNVNMNDEGRGAVFGKDFGYGRNGVSVSRYDNQNITWEIDRQLSLGFEAGLFDAFDVMVEYFSRNRSNILMTRTSIPSSMGLAAGVRANVGEAKSSGIDMSVDYNKYFTNDFWVQGRVNLTYATSEFSVYEEPDYDQWYLSRVGQSLSQQYGLIAERLFVDDEEVANSPTQNFGEVRGGDIKYRDVNGDGEITSLDVVPIGHPTDPEIIYGFGLSTGFKGFDFSAFFQGSARSSFWIDPNATAPFVSYYYDNETLPAQPQNALLQAYADSHWSEENRDVYALWPRLSTTRVDNNVQRSTWFMRDGSFVRLKSLELGYSLPEKFISKVHLSQTRIYFSGINLLTFSKFKLWDPEMGSNGLGYPVQKVFNLGIQLQF